MSGGPALGDYRWVNVKAGNRITPPCQAHYARHEPLSEAAPLVAICGFMFAPEDAPGRLAELYPYCRVCLVGERARAEGLEHGRAAERERQFAAEAGS